MNGKCPSCNTLVSTLRGDGVDVSFMNGRSFKAVTYCCPFCNVVLGCQIDPIALKTDTVSEIVQQVLQALRK